MKDICKKISIIVPIYNAEQYLKDCLNSIVRQTYENYEIILVNDGSTDGSERICRDYMESVPSIRYYKTKNVGVSSARNFGIEQATGEWLFFVDADDVISTQSLEVLVHQINKGIDWIIGAYSSEFNKFETRSKTEFYNAMEMQKLILNSPNYKNLYKKFPFPFDDIVLMTVWGKLYRRSIIVESKIAFQTDLKVSEDVVFNYEYVRQSKISVVISDILYYYRKSENSASCQVDESRIQNLKNLVSYMQKIRAKAEDNMKHDIDVYCCKMIVIWADKIKRYGMTELKEKFTSDFNAIWKAYFKKIRVWDKMSRGKLQNVQYTLIVFFIKLGKFRMVMKVPE